MNLSKQEFLNTADSAKYIQDKRKLRAELEKEMAKFLKRGGEIKQAVSKPIHISHGNNTKYTKQGCRCQKCMSWAIKTGKVKTTTLRARA